MGPCLRCVVGKEFLEAPTYNTVVNFSRVRRKAWITVGSMRLVSTKRKRQSSMGNLAQLVCRRKLRALPHGKVRHIDFEPISAESKSELYLDVSITEVET